MTTEPTTLVWDAYAAEAQQAPLDIKVSADDTIRITPPSGAAVVQFSRAYRAGDLEAMLWALCGEAWPRVQELIGTAPLKAMENLIADIALHFDLYPEVSLTGPGGGSTTEKDPRRIEQKLKTGWTIRGNGMTSPA